MLIIDSINDLEAVLLQYDEGYLFRGQNKHHLKGGDTSIVSSFARLGCHPPSMQKWWHYCDEVMLSMFGPDSDRKLTFDESNALLQHYGWRSFYIDASKDPTVATWFASQKYVGKRSLVITEDCYEIGVCCSINHGAYEPSQDYGYLYIISKDKLTEHDIEYHDLYKLGFSDFNPRYIKQSGVMIGSCSQIPIDAIVETLKVSSSVLKEHSSSHSVESLFPNRQEDKIYNILLSTPFEEVNGDGEIKNFFYKRSLDIPEYDFNFTKINSPNIAFYNTQHAINSEDFEDNTVFRCPDSFLYHTEIESPDDLSELVKCLPVGARATVECDGLLRLPPFFDKPLFLKGAQIHRIEDNLYCVGGLTVKFQGTKLNYVQLDDGWHYEMNSGAFERMLKKNDCPCNYARKHQLVFTILKKANLAITNSAFSMSEGVTYLTDEY